MSEQLLKTSGTDVLFSGKKLRKTLQEGEWGGVASTQPLSPRVERNIDDSQAPAFLTGGHI